MTGRRCGSCKHYEPAPIWRKGWCRNPILYAPQQSHLVSEEDLDCERGMGNYWELSASAVDGEFIPIASIERANHRASAERRAEQPLYRTNSGRTIYPVTGSSGYVDDPDDDLPPGERGAGPRGRDRQLDYYTEERYWTDYVRIGLPILGILIVFIVALLWILPFFTDDDGDNGDLGVGGTATPTLPVIGAATPTQTSQVGATGTAQIVLTPPPAATTPAALGPDPTATDEAAEPSGEIYAGATVRVGNTGGTGVNMRASASVDGEIVTVLQDGAELVTIGEAEEADGFLWWPVEGEAGTGYVVEDYLILVE